MKITLPENISEITLRQFLAYEKLIERDLDVYNFNKRKINIFTGIPVNQIDNVKGVDAERILNQIDTALNTDSEFVNRFTMHGIEFGFIPNLDKMTLGEYADLSKHGVEKESLHNLMAVLFRPIVKKEIVKQNIFKRMFYKSKNVKEQIKYDILSYNGSEEYAEFMKDMPLHVVNGALVFFYNLANELQEATRKYLSEELLKDQKLKTISKTSVGILRLKSWLRTTFSK